MWQRSRAALLSFVAGLVSVTLGSALPAPLLAQSEEGRRVVAVLTDWTGNFIGNAEQAQRVRDETRRRVLELLFPASGEASPLGFDPEKDRLFIARFGLVTDRRGIRPLRDFLQIQLDLDVDLARLDDRARKRRIDRAFDRDAGQFRTRRGNYGAQWGFPTVVWSIAVDRINRHARREKLDFESLVLVLVSDDVPNLGKGLAGEAAVCARVLRSYNRDDAQRFEDFYDIYTRELTTERINVGIAPITGVGEDGEAILRAFRIAPEVAGVDLNQVFNVDARGFSVRRGGAYRGELRLRLDPLRLAPAALGELEAELFDSAGTPRFGPREIPLDREETVWSELPGELGSGTREARQYRLRLRGELTYPEIQDLSQFHTHFLYESPVKVELVGLLRLADGSLLSGERMEEGETPEEARRRIDGFKAVAANFKWGTIAVAAAALALVIFYFAFWVRPPLLALHGRSKSAILNWRDGDEVLQAMPVGTLEITNRQSRGGVHREWIAELEISDVRSDHDLVTAVDASLAELFTFSSRGESRLLSGELAGKKSESVPLYLRAERIRDLKAPGLCDETGHFRTELTVRVALRTAHKVAAEGCELQVPVTFAVARAGFSSEWTAAPEPPVFFYNELREAPAEIASFRIVRRAEREALWPSEVRLAVRDPEGAEIRGLRLLAADPSPEGEKLDIDETSAEVRIGRFGLRSEIRLGVEYSARDLAVPTVRDTEIPLRIFDLSGDEPKPLGAPMVFRVGLAIKEPWPVVRLEGFQKGRRATLLDYPERDHSELDRPELDRPELDRPECDGLVRDRPELLDPAYPILSGRRLVDPWTLLMTLELGNAAEKPQPETGADGSVDPGIVALQFEPLAIRSDLSGLGLDAAELAACFRLVKKSERERDSAKATNVLETGWPFGKLEPGPNATEIYQLELNQLGFEKLARDTARIDFSLRFKGLVRDVEVERFSLRFRLPLIANYGSRWFLMDIGTSTIVAMAMDARQEFSRLLDLTPSSGVALPGAASENRDARLLSSTLFIEKDTAAEGGYRLEFRDSPESVEVSDAYRLLPPFKLLVGSKRLPLQREELRELELDEAPPVDDILKKALGTLVETYVKPALLRLGEEEGEALPRQVLLPIPNTFTPAHVALIRDLFRDELDARRVVFLSESDAICWRYLTLIEDGRERLPERFHQGLEYILIVDIGAGTTDLTYVAVGRHSADGLDRVSILHRDGFRVAGNNVDTCLGRIVHHKLRTLNALGDDSPYLYDARKRIFRTEGSGRQEELLDERMLYPVVLGLRQMKAELSSEAHQEVHRLRISRDIEMFTEQRLASGEARDWVLRWLKVGTGEGQRSVDIRMTRTEILHAPAYSRLVHREMCSDILRHFFAGCPESWEDAPESWCEDGRFPVDTLIVTGRGGLTPGLRPAIEVALDDFRLSTEEAVRQPDFSRNGTPEELKLAVVEGGRDYVERFGPESGIGNRDVIRDRGLYEDYYLYTGPGKSFKRRYKLLDRDHHQVEVIGGENAGGGPVLRLFTHPERTWVDFKDFDGAVMVIATSSRIPPEDPKRPDTFIRPLCQFSQENRNREVEIYFEVDSNHNFRLLVDGTDIGGREHRYESEFLEDLPGVLENMWPGRPCDPGDPADFYSPWLPRAGPEPAAKAPEIEALSSSEVAVSEVAVSEVAASELPEAAAAAPEPLETAMPEPPEEESRSEVSTSADDEEDPPAAKEPRDRVVAAPFAEEPLQEGVPATARPSGPKISYADFED